MLALAAVFPFLILVLGLFGTLVLYLTAAPLVGLSILAYRLKHLNGQSEESLPRPALPSPPAVAALAAAPGIPVLSKPAILKQASTPSRPPIPLGPAVSVAEDADSDGDSAAAPSPTAAEPAEEANAHAETASDIAEAYPIAEEEPPDSLSPRNLVDKALAAASRLDFVEAVTLLNSALSQRPEPGLQWFILGELSTIYQHLGQYRLADALIGAFLLNPPDTEHPLVPVLRQKQAFCRSLDRLLAYRGTPNLGYEAVPDELRRLAFLEATAGFRSH